MKVVTEGRKITFTFEGLAPIVFDASAVNPALHERAAMHGWEQRLRDNAAIARKQKDGTVITVTEAMRREAVEELVRHYESGSPDWNVRGTRAAPQNATILAIAARMGCTYAEAEAEVQRRMLAELEAA